MVPCYIPAVVPCYPHSVRYTLPVHLPGYTAVLYSSPAGPAEACSCAQCGTAGPWALSFRSSLGSGPFASQVLPSLLQFLSPDPASFPDRPRSRTDRSDGGRANRLLAAYGSSDVRGRRSRCHRLVMSGEKKEARSSYRLVITSRIDRPVTH